MNRLKKYEIEDEDGEVKVNPIIYEADALRNGNNHNKIYKMKSSEKFVSKNIQYFIGQIEMFFISPHFYRIQTEPITIYFPDYLRVGLTFADKIL